MKKYIAALSFIAAVLTVASCSEFGPVFTGRYGEPDPAKVYTQEEIEAEGFTFVTIKDLKAMYAANGSAPLNIKDEIAIAGKVTSSDEEGNFYRSFYIQDETSGIEIKVGLTGLYNEYKLGWWVYVKLKGLTLGDYNGTLQVGYEDATGEYESAYMGVRSLVEAHVLKGSQGTAVEPVQLAEGSDLTSEEYVGKLVSVSGASYTRTMFCLAYVDPDQNHQSQSNRIFLDEEGSWGVRTWAMSDTQFETYLNAGNFDAASTADNSNSVEDLRKSGSIKSTAYAVTQYFRWKSTTLGVRTSGYAKFSDIEIPEAVWRGTATINFVGVLTLYDGEPQLTLIDQDGYSVNY